MHPPEPASPPSGLPRHPLNWHTPGLRIHREPHRISASPNRTHRVGDPGTPEGKGGAPASPRRQGPLRRQALRAPAGPCDPPSPDLRLSSLDLILPSDRVGWRAHPRSGCSPRRDPNLGTTPATLRYSPSAPHAPIQSSPSRLALHLSAGKPQPSADSEQESEANRSPLPPPRAGLSKTWLQSFPGPSWDTPDRTPTPPTVPNSLPRGARVESPSPRAQRQDALSNRGCGAPYLSAAAAGPRANSRRRPRGKLSRGR